MNNPSELALKYAAKILYQLSEPGLITVANVIDEAIQEMCHTQPEDNAELFLDGCERDLNYMKALTAKVLILIATNAIHKHRGFHINDVKSIDIMSHMLEENVESLDALLSGDKEHLKEELGDVLSCLVHLAIKEYINIDELIESACEKLDAYWTLDESEVLTDNPGIRQRNKV